jgi:hypothetical protein
VLYVQHNFSHLNLSYYRLCKVKQIHALPIAILQLLINFMMRNFLILLSVFMVSLTATAQFPGMGGRPGGAAGGNQNTNIGHFYGKIEDSKTKKGVEGVTVQLKGNKFDTVSKKMKEAILGTYILS